MFPRVLFLLLLALTIGGACWIAFAPQQEAPAKFVADPGVPELVLLSERDSRSAPVATRGTAPDSASSSDICLSIGPFQTQSDMRATLNSLSPVVKRIQYRDERATQSRGYWVFLAAMKNREEALGVARSLSAKGVRDYYVVTAGDQLNTISLGLFREQANAERRKSEIAAMGFSPQLVQRTEELPVYWVDLARERDRTIDWRTHVTNTNGLEERVIDCF
jgi:hypothetical protein